MALIKFIASQAHTIFQYKNIRNKVLKCCANMYFNKQCLNNEIIPNYANIKLPKISPAASKTQKKVHVMRIKDEIRFLYKKKEQLNDTMYKIHLKAAQEWGSMWQIILESVTESTNREIERKYSNIDKKIKTLSKAQTRNNEIQKSFYPRVDNRTKINFSGNELTLLNKGLKYNLNYKPKNWVKNLALEAETAIMHLPYAEQEGMRFMVA
jgi:hypothetical protein